MKKAKKQFVSDHSDRQNTGFARALKTTPSSSPLHGFFGSGYTITEDVLM